MLPADACLPSCSGRGAVPDSSLRWGRPRRRVTVASLQQPQSQQQHQQAATAAAGRTAALPPARAFAAAGLGYASSAVAASTAVDTEAASDQQQQPLPVVPTAGDGLRDDEGLLRNRPRPLKINLDLALVRWLYALGCSIQAWLAPAFSALLGAHSCCAVAVGMAVCLQLPTACLSPPHTHALTHPPTTTCHACPQYRARQKRLVAVSSRLAPDRARMLREVEESLRRCQAMFPEDGRSYVSLGKLMVQQRRYDEALALYEEGCTATGARWDGWVGWERGQYSRCE